MSIFDDPAIIPGKALDQPYAGAILLSAWGYPGKTIETRTTRILRVPTDLVIIAGVTVQDQAMVRLHRLLVGSGCVPGDVFDRAMSVRGAAVVLARVIDCRRLTADDAGASLWWDEAENARKPRWAWCLDSMRPLRPFRVRGIPGFTRVPREQVEAAL